MNTAGQVGGVLSPIVLAYIVDRFGNWSMPIDILSGLYFIAAVCWLVSVRTGVHLLHFDAKAHLVVARRTLDSLTPGWTQLGAVWLPLPHILAALPSQVDALYATGLAGSLLSFLFPA